MSERPLSGLRLFGALAAVVVITCLALLALIVRPRSTVAELTLELREVEIHVLGPAPPATDVPLLAGGLRFGRVTFSDFTEASLRVARHPGDAAIVPGARDASLRLSGDPFGLELFLREDAVVHIPRLGRRGALTLEFSAAKDIAWRSIVQSGQDLDGELQGVPSTSRFPTRGGQASVSVGAIPAVQVIGGTFPSRVTVKLPTRERTGGTRVHAIDLSDGSVKELAHTDLVLDDPELVVSAGERLLVLQREEEARGLAVLNPGLQVRDVLTYRLEGKQGRSWLAGGRIRFPGGEREPLELEAEAYLDIEADEPLTVRSARVDGDRLELVVWGEPQSLRYGPTIGMMHESLPSTLAWLYTHKAVSLAFSVLVWIVATTIAALNLFGRLRK